MSKIFDKSKELVVDINLLNQKLHFSGWVNGNDPISIDYIDPLGDNLGYTSLELFLLSLSSFMGSAILVLLRKMQKNIEAFEMKASGIRNEEHPTGFKSICLQIKLSSRNTSAEELEKAISLSKETYCPVGSMLKGNVEIKILHNLK